MPENNKNSGLYMKNDVLGPGGSMMTDAELARLEVLASPYANAPAWKIEDTQNICTRATPALVAEVRRLREALERIAKHEATVKYDDLARWEANAKWLGTNPIIDHVTLPTVKAQLSAIQPLIAGIMSAWEESIDLRDRVEALEKTKKHLSETARVLAEQVGNGNLGKIQDALNYAHYKASEREAIR